MIVSVFKERILYLTVITSLQNMKKEASVLLAGSLGVLTVLGIIGIRNFLKAKRLRYSEEYADYHRLYGKRYEKEDEDGVEFLALL